MKTLTKFQDIINKINAKQDFTINLSGSKNRYILSLENIYTGKNPSLFFDLPIVLREYFNLNYYDSIGGWLDKENNLYYVDFNFHFQDLETVLKFAKKTNQIAIYDNLKKQVIYINNKNQ